MANFKSNGEFIRTRQICYLTTYQGYLSRERELTYEGSVAKNATVQTEGNRQVIRDVEFYNLNVIISVGYRVYHLGASIKDLGKKWFAFNRMEMTTTELLKKI